MNTTWTRRLLSLGIMIALLGASTPLRAEDDEASEEAVEEVEQPRPAAPVKKKAKTKKKRAYHIEDIERTDAGVFHVAFAAGGNFYVEPKFSKTTGQPTGDYFKDFGFQGGAFFDYDYSELTENVPLGLRGMIGYKYILQSTHVFAFDGLARIMWRLSDDVTFGLGMGVSLGTWYRAETALSTEETKFLPCGIIGAGFEFNPFMVDLKWLINRFGADSTITGVELYFGFRL
jgi:hypothetical protein